MRRFLKLKAVALFLLFATCVLAILPSLVPDADEKLPTVITETFKRKFKFGLDLQGGLHLEYSVAVDEAIEHKLDTVAAELEASFKDKVDLDVNVERVGIDTLKVRLPKPEDVALAKDDVIGVTFGILERVPSDEADEKESDGVLTFKMPAEVINENRAAAVSNALETVRKRVDAMGVAEPNIYPKNRQIVVELPGLSDTTTEAKAAAQDASDRIRELLVAAGASQVVIGEVEGDPWAFKVTVPDGQIADLLEQTFPGKILESGLIIDDRLTNELELRKDVSIANDPSSTVLALSAAAQEKVLEDSSDFRRLLKVIERQAVLTMHLVDDETPYKNTGKPYLKAIYEAGLVRQGMGIAVNVEPDYGRDNGIQVKEPYAFYAKDVDTLKNFFDSLPPEWRLPSEWMVAYGPTPVMTRKGINSEPELLFKTYILKSRAGVTGDRIINAGVGFDQQTGQPQVDVKLDRIGAGLMEELSSDNVGRKMAIVLDDLVRSDPIFNERLSGDFRITLGSAPGESPREAANDLTKVLKSGSLPARLQKEFEIRVGADLGRESVEQGFYAFVFGLAAVVIFMIIYYRWSGVIAVIAVVINLVMMLALMAFFGSTLTLPGIAGIVLTIGMAVDANVIIYERIRDYIREGFTARAAIESGYDRAFTTILDGQLTTAIAGLVLYQYGSGPIQGFAVTLMIGIATSIFTGVWCTRLFFDFQSNRRGFERVSV
jgi:protein-export membrane protein SecD